MRDWKAVARKTGPLRYQMSESDCVPTTVVNGMIFLLQRRIHPRLLNMIWHISVETKTGCGWVTSQLLSDVLNSWFTRAHYDGNEKDVLPFESRIIEDDAAHLERNNTLMRALNAGGVCCLTVNNGRHYILVLATNGRQFLAFDPYWNRTIASTSHQDAFSIYHGLVNTEFTRAEIQESLSVSNNKWLHVIAPLGAI